MEHFLSAVGTLVGVVIMYVLIPYIKSKTTAEQRAEVEYWVSVAVSSAEQIYNSEQGSTKLLYVQNFLSTKGFDVELEEIESAVFWLKEQSGVILSEQ